MKQEENQEIDLSYILFTLLRHIKNITVFIFKGLGQLFCRLYKKFCLMCRFIRKHLLIFIISICISVGLGFITKAFIPKHYYTDFIVETQIVPIEQYADIINSLDNYIRKSNYVDLAKMLRISLEDAKNIVSIEAKIFTSTISVSALTSTIAKDWMKYDSLKDVEIKLLQIQLTTKDNTIFENIQKGIDLIISTHDNIQVRYKAYLHTNQIQQENLVKQIEILEAFQKKNLEQFTNNLSLGNNPMTLVVEEKTYIEEIINNKNNLAYTQEKASIIKPFTILRSVVPPTDPICRPVILYILICWMIIWATMVCILKNCDYKKTKTNING